MSTCCKGLIPFAVLALLCAAASAARAAGKPPRDAAPQVELFASTLFLDDVSEGALGLRGGIALSTRWMLEGAFYRLTDDDEIFLTDVSAKYYLRNKGRTGVYLLAGPELLWGGDVHREVYLMHAGFGAEFDLGRRLVLRPEYGARWLLEDIAAETFHELSLGIGWRF